MNGDASYFKIKKGLNKSVVAEISERKSEPGWMTDFRLEALKIFERLPIPTWGVNLDDLKMEDIYCYICPFKQQKQSWDDVPGSIKTTFDRLGIPQAEQAFLAGVGVQYESEMFYKSLKEQWKKQGVIFLDMNEGLEQHPELFKRYFSTIVPAHDNKYAALNSAVWSGGSFIYVPKNVCIEMPLQAYFRMNEPQLGQFERTLLIADEGSSVHYIEGCSAPRYSVNSLHSAVVEICAHAHAHVRYTTIQNWSNNVYNLVTKRAVVYKKAKIEWVDGNFGSKVTMKYPSIILKGHGSQGHLLSIAVAGKGQVHDTGAKIIHEASKTRSHVVSKSISKDGGTSIYRGLLKVKEAAAGVKSHVTCDALMLDNNSRSDTYPTIDVAGKQVDIGHEASIKKIDEQQLFYLLSRGLTKEYARAMIVNGFVSEFVQSLPMEYAVEINRLIEMEMDGFVG